MLKCDRCKKKKEILVQIKKLNHEQSEREYWWCRDCFLHSYAE